MLNVCTLVDVGVLQLNAHTVLKSWRGIASSDGETLVMQINSNYVINQCRDCPSLFWSFVGTHQILRRGCTKRGRNVVRL